jgi:hypothetical protein
MFNQHVTAKLSAYCNGELSKEESQQVAEHLLSCQKCRQEYDEIKLGIQFATRLPQLSAPDSLWSEIENLLDAQTAKPVAPISRRGFAFNFGWQKLAFASTFLFLVFAIAGVFWYNTNLSNQLEAAKKDVFGNPPANDTPGLPDIEIAPIGNGDNTGIANNNTSRVGDTNNDKRDLGRRTNRLPKESGSTGACAVARLEGAPVIGNALLTDKGKIAVGEWLETDSTSRAEITVGEIGHVEVAPNTRIQLVEARENEHRLQLAVGQMHAKIYAPPRIFFVQTPTAEAIDLGCEYTLDVDEDGTSILRVQSGWVAFVCNGRESLVPEGARSITRRGFAPGTPYFESASEQFKQAINKFDFEKGGNRELAVLIKEATARDTLTLWHLLSRVGKTERIRLYDRMVGFVSLPDDVTRAGILRLDKEMLRLWKLDLEVEWYAQPTKKE